MGGVGWRNSCRPGKQIRFNEKDSDEEAVPAFLKKGLGRRSDRRSARPSLRALYDYRDGPFARPRRTVRPSSIFSNDLIFEVAKG